MSAVGTRVRKNIVKTEISRYIYRETFCYRDDISRKVLFYRDILGNNHDSFHVSRGRNMPPYQRIFFFSLIY